MSEKVESCTCGACVVPLVDVVGAMTTSQAEQWAASEGIALRSTWDRRAALSASDAAAVFERASARAESARRRNEAKVAATAAAANPVLPGRPVPEGLGDVAAVDVMRSAEWEERLDAADSRYKDYTSADVVYYPLHPGQG